MKTLQSGHRRLLLWQLMGLACLLTALIGLGTMLPERAGRSMAELSTSTALTRQQTVATGQLLQHLLDAETGQRGFLLTGRPEYLTPFSEAASLIGRTLDDLRATSAAKPWLAEEVGQLATLTDAKLAELQQTIRLAQSGDRAGAMAIVQTDRGKALMDEARATVSRITERLDAEDLRQSERLLDRQTRLALLSQVAVVTGIILLGIALAIALFSRAFLATAQAQQKRVGDRLAAAIDRFRDGVAVFDAQDRLTLRNDRLATVLGLSPAQVTPGRTGAHIAASAGLDLLRAPARAGDEPVETVLGNRTLEVWQGSMPEGGRFLAVADITRRVAAEEVARQAQKMDVLGQMTGGVAHDFNNLLQVVSANLELASNRLARAATPDPWILTRLEAARSGVTRGARLTRHLLAFARRQPLAPEAVDPSQLLVGLDDMLRRTVGAPIELQLVTGDGLWPVRADPNQLENALLNLALNGRDAIGASGTASGHLTVEAANVTLDTDAAATREVTAGAYVLFSVTDNGTGMTPEQIARATEPFYTTKPDGHGTGLGLSMVFGFAKQSGGHFKLYSEPGQGTTARLYLPRSDTPAEGASVAADQMQECGGGELVLLVEDDPAVRTTGAEALRSLGYAVTESASASAALALITQGLRPDIVFTDIVMPGKLSARALAEQAVAIIPGLPVLFTSGYTQNAIVHNGTLDPGITLISKPWQLDELARELHRALDHRRQNAPAKQPPALPAKTVLLVEDEAFIRMTTADALTDLGYTVVQAADGATALAHLAGTDLVLLDLGLPDMPGLTVARQMRASRPDLRIIIASGQGDPVPGYRWLPKPYDFATLTTALAQAWSEPP